MKNKRFNDMKDKENELISDDRMLDLIEQNKALAESYSKLQVRLGESEARNNELIEENKSLKEEKDRIRNALKDNWISVTSQVFPVPELPFKKPNQ